MGISPIKHTHEAFLANVIFFTCTLPVIGSKIVSNWTFFDDGEGWVSGNRTWNETCGTENLVEVCQGLIGDPTSFSCCSSNGL